MATAKGGRNHTAPQGQPGCCSSAPFMVDLECSGIVDSAQGWLRVDNPTQLDCAPYNLTFHF